jgi:17beta-estradiol 17-dehydrogenase / very-long-chain 3-oxoacyl-CoA reductase
MVYSVLFHLKRTFIRPVFQSNLYSKYGLKGTYETWAVVTGGYDGIGFAMAKDLAKKGFNILIIGRNENKIRDRIAEIEGQLNIKQLQIDYFVADFAKLDKISDYKNLIADKI